LSLWILKSALCYVLTNPALELPLDQGLRLERRLFQSLFATQDQKEGE
jgi:enoyl-CoA hydratase